MTKCSVRAGKAQGEELRVTEHCRRLVSGGNASPWDTRNKLIKLKAESNAVIDKVMGTRSDICSDHQLIVSCFQFLSEKESPKLASHILPVFEKSLEH